MGDVAMCVPVVKALRDAYPDLRITILTREKFAPFFRGISGIEFLYLLPQGRHKGIKGILALYRDVKVLDTDAFADLHGVLRTRGLRILLTLSGVRTATIDKGRYAKHLLTRKYRKERVPLKHTVLRYRDVLLRLGLRIPVPPAAEKEIYPFPEQLVEAAGTKNGTWIGVAPFAKHRGKIYPIRLMDELIAQLASRHERIFIFGGGPYEKDFAECMESRYRGVVSVVGRMSLSQELDVIGSLDAIVTMDSSALHMASLVGTPAISVWGATHPFAGFYGWGQHESNAVQLDMPCRPCSVYGNKPCIFNDYRCMENILPQAIVMRVEEALARCSTTGGKEGKEDENRACPVKNFTQGPLYETK